MLLSLASNPSEYPQEPINTINFMDINQPPLSQGLKRAGARLPIVTKFFDLAIRYFCQRLPSCW